MVWAGEHLTYHTMALTPPLKKEFSTIIEDAIFYKVHSIPISDLVKTDNNVGMYGRIELDFTKIISSNELLPEDNFTHHTISGVDDYQYNSRLHIGNTFTYPAPPLDNSFNNPVIGIKSDLSGLELPVDATDPAGIIDTTPYPGLVIKSRVYIKTTNGIVTVDGDVPKNSPETSGIDGTDIAGGFTPGNYTYSMMLSDGGAKYIPLRNIISYPDYRAYKIVFYYSYLGINYKLQVFDLKPASGMNIGYYGSISEINVPAEHIPFIALWIPSVLTSGTVFPDELHTSVIHDTNRLQVSGIFNPFIWPSVNSYRFGMAHNSLIAIRSVQAQMSDSQFGQYPLYVFSTDGAFTIMHGSGEVLYSSIQPLNNEVLLSRDAITSISGAIVYATKEGVRILSGATGELISIPVNGSIINPIASDPLFNSSLTGLNLPNINVFRSDVPFLTYIQGCIILYDIYNTEIIISNATYKYSYVFNLTTKAWSTRTEVFTGNLFVAGRSVGVKESTWVDGEDTVLKTALCYLDEENDQDVVSSVVGGISVKYGALYNWYAATDVRGISSGGGWVVPTRANFQILSNYLGGDTIAGGYLKETGFVYWDNTNIGTNQVGYNARGNGNRLGTGVFVGKTSVALMRILENVGLYRAVRFSSGSASLAVGISNANSPQEGFSIRLFRPATTPELLQANGTPCANYTGNDGKVYRTVKIGTQIWLADNLCETKYADDSTIPNVTDNTAWSALTTGGMCYYDNDITNAYTDTTSTLVTTLADCKYLLLQTRPLRLSSVLAKRIDKIMLRSLYNIPAGEYSIFQVYGSNDLVTWSIVTYQQCMTGFDVHANRLMGNYKYFTVVFACSRAGATVQQMDVLYTEKFGKLL
jgi:uncharacterized protein (TIGR02145 family)